VRPVLCLPPGLPRALAVRAALVCVTLKLQVRERMVLMNRQEIRAGEIPRCLPCWEVDFAFNDGNETTKEAFIFSVVGVVPGRCSCFV